MKGFGKVFTFEFRKMFLRKMLIVFIVITALLSAAGNAMNYYVFKIFVPQMEELSKQQAKAQSEQGSGSAAGESGEDRNSGSSGSNVDIETNIMPVFKITVEEKIEQYESTVEMQKKLQKDKSRDFSSAALANSENGLAKLNYELEHGLIKKTDEYKDPRSTFDIEDEQVLWRTAVSGANFSILFAFAATMLVVSVAGEQEKGHIKSLLTRPVSRQAVLTAKYLCAVIYFVILQLSYLAAHLLSGLIFFGAGNPLGTHVFALFGHAFGMPFVLALLPVYALQLASVLLPLALTMLLAVSIRSSAGTIALSLTILFVVNNLLTQMCHIFPVLRFTPFVNMNLETYLTYGVLVDNTNIVFSAVVCLVYLIIFASGASLIFRKRDI